MNLLDYVLPIMGLVTLSLFYIAMLIRTNNSKYRNRRRLLN
jgi:hypothetical protein